jgi:hypothetical protein
MGLEDKIKNIRSSISISTWRGLECAVDLYNQAYDRHPRTTRFLSTAIGTVGGDYIAKKIVEGKDITLRDIAFTTFAAVYQSYFYPKIIDYTEKIAEIKPIKQAYQKLGISKEWAKTFIIGGLFFVPNMLYWGLLSVKNKAPITTKTILRAAKSITIGSVPYLGVDYLVTNKLKKRYCLPIWSAAEVAYNTFLAGVAYVTKS